MRNEDLACFFPASGKDRPFVSCSLVNRVRVGESVMSLVTLGTDLDMPHSVIWLAKGSIEEPREEEIMETDSDHEVHDGNAGKCRYFYHHKKVGARFKQKVASKTSSSSSSSSMALLRHNKK